jgi:hypothetical protein
VRPEAGLGGGRRCLGDRRCATRRGRFASASSRP